MWKKSHELCEIKLQTMCSPEALISVSLTLFPIQTASETSVPVLNSSQNGSLYTNYVDPADAAISIAMERIWESSTPNSHPVPAGPACQQNTPTHAPHHPTHAGRLPGEH